MSGPRVVPVTGSAGVLGSRLMRLLAGRDVRGIDRRDGHELADPRSKEGHPARFVDESARADAEDGYATSKRGSERIAARSGLELVALRLARFAERGDPQDDVRLLYRAIDPIPAAPSAIKTRYVRRGSSTSRRPSPRRFTPSTASVMRAPGNTVIHHATPM